MLKRYGPVFQDVITLAHTFTMNHVAGDDSGYGSQKLKDFPEGRILVHGVVVNARFAAGVGGIAAAAEGDFALGTTAVDDSDALAGTEVDLCPSTAFTFDAGIVASAHAALAASAQFDGTSTAKDCYLNVRIDAGDQSAADEIYATGTVTITWSNLGDY